MSFPLVSEEPAVRRRGQLLGKRSSGYDRVPLSIEEQRINKATRFVPEIHP
ncbi:MAG TPA: hypothetical protein VGM60_06885 [Pseudonocardia sp.]